MASCLGLPTAQDSLCGNSSYQSGKPFFSAYFPHLVPITEVAIHSS
ncbi:hypothetical protein IQ265_25420 [Nodosilinea sp. LEGE 06152]|nr:hypothetical protein [Nodosilinea sp. LEGE 06152]MBE9160139.1 hypothetical protein [Nodosilinea sp. LEGE 06152]